MKTNHNHWQRGGVGLLGVMLLAGTALGSVLAAQPSSGCCGRMQRGLSLDERDQADMQLFHELAASRRQIKRQVTLRPDGVETLTESDDPEVARKIQTHVESMSARVKEARPIHRRDPLFREIFNHTDRIVMQHELTPTGVRVVETSADPYVVRLIQAHAEVVSAFIANGRSEMMKNHAVPERAR